MITNDDMSALFSALAHTSRRQILDILRDKPGSTVGQVAQAFDVSRIAVMNHISVLESAGLITSEQRGRTRCLYLNAAPLQLIQDRWMGRYTTHFATKLADLKYAAEANSDTKREGDT